MSTRLDEIRTRHDAVSFGRDHDSTNVVDVLLDQDIPYLLERVERLEGFLWELKYCLEENTHDPDEVAMRIVDRALEPADG